MLQYLHKRYTTLSQSSTAGKRHPTHARAYCVITTFSTQAIASFTSLVLKSEGLQQDREACSRRRGGCCSNMLCVRPRARGGHEKTTHRSGEAKKKLEGAPRVVHAFWASAAADDTAAGMVKRSPDGETSNTGRGAMAAISSA